MDAIEELEAAYERLEATVEELRATREELECRNEQLETAGEEMRALGEALRAVDAELRGRRQELARTDDDLQNLLHGIGTHIAIVFLDADLQIRRFTERAGEVTGLGPDDLGRPLQRLSEAFRDRDLEPPARGVLDTVIPTEIEVQPKEGGRHLLRILPYRTSQNLIDGLLVVLFDVTSKREFRRTTGGDA